MANFEYCTDLMGAYHSGDNGTKGYLEPDEVGADVRFAAEYRAERT
jgi:hypothetical protein